MHLTEINRDWILWAIIIFSIVICYAIYLLEKFEKKNEQKVRDKFKQENPPCGQPGHTCTCKKQDSKSKLYFTTDENDNLTMREHGTNFTKLIPNLGKFQINQSLEDFAKVEVLYLGEDNIFIRKEKVQQMLENVMRSGKYPTKDLEV